MELTVAETKGASTAPAALSSNTSTRKRFQARDKSHAPTVVLRPDGSIEDATPSALHLLEYRGGQRIDSSFFTHVHGKNLYQVMRDVADMVCYGKSQATWLLRLRTGQGRWRWYKAVVRNRLEEENVIQIHLDEQNAW